MVRWKGPTEVAVSRSGQREPKVNLVQVSRNRFGSREADSFSFLIIDLPSLDPLTLHVLLLSNTSLRRYRKPLQQFLLDSPSLFLLGFSLPKLDHSKTIPKLLELLSVHQSTRDTTIRSRGKELSSELDGKTNGFQMEQIK